MPATVQIDRITGTSPGSATNITGINTRANAEDAHSVADTLNPVTIPTSGSNYSYWVTTQLNVIGGLAGTIDNLRWYMSGAVDAGLSLVGETATTYVQATGVVGESGDILNTTNHPNLAGAPTDLTAFTSGSPKAVAGSITASTGLFGDQLVYQYVVSTSAEPGAATPVTMTWRYDET